MSVIEAAQVVFGNVEADQSPQRRGGFQVLFRSLSSLTEDEVTREIEPRLFFVAGDSRDVKHAFFATRNGKVAVARCVPEAGKDQFSRTGLYLAHALVFKPEDFLRLDHDPFRVFDHFQFFSSFEEASAAASLSDGDIPLARVSDNGPAARDTSCPTTREHLFSLLMLFYRFTLSQNQEGAIAFYGQSSKMLSVLRSLFLMLPIRLRPNCTFDTFFVGGGFGKMPNFAIGFPETHTRDPRFIHFDVERESFGAAIDFQPKTAFESWLKWMFAPPLSDLSKQVDEALYVSELFDGRRLSGDVLQQVGPRNLPLGFQSLLEGRLRERLRAQIGDALTERLFPQAIAWMEQQGTAALTPMVEGFSVQQLEQWLVEAYASSREKPHASEIRGLEEFYSRNQRSVLSLIYLRWTGQWSALRASLQSAETATAVRFTKWALTSLKPFIRPAAQPGILLSLGLHAEGDELQETANLLAAVLDKSLDEILSNANPEGAASVGQIPIEQLIKLYALIVEGP